MAKKKAESEKKPLEKDINGHELLSVESEKTSLEDVALVTGLTVTALKNLNPELKGREELEKGEIIRIS